MKKQFLNLLTIALVFPALFGCTSYAEQTGTKGEKEKSMTVAPIIPMAT